MVCRHNFPSPDVFSRVLANADRRNDVKSPIVCCCRPTCVPNRPESFEFFPVRSEE